MGVSPAKFDSAGQSTQHLIPGVYSRRNTIGAGSGVSSGNLVIIGPSVGGKPLTLLSVADKAEAKDLLVSGQLLDGVVHAFNGSNTFVPQEVFCMRINAGTRSSLALKNGDNSILSVKSADYGILANQQKIWIKDGSEAGKKIELISRGSEVEVDNIEKKSISILYTGEGKSATCSIDKDGIELKAMDNGDQEIDTLEATWEEYETIEELVARINDTEVYAATIIDSTPSAKSAELDHVANVSVKGSQATVFSSDLQALIDALKSIFHISEVSLLGTDRLIPDNNIRYEYFTGAQAGTSTIGDWIAALDVLEQENIQIIATPSTDQEVHVLIADHCVNMSTVSKKRERTFWVGTDIGVSIENGIAKARGFGTELGSLVITDANAANPLTGKSENISPALLACKCAGIEAAIGVSNPLTNKMIKVNSFGKKYKERELNRMIAGGIVPFGENDDGELVCIRAITCYQGDSLILNERSMIRSVLFMDRDLRRAYSRRTGTNSEPSDSDILQVLINKSKEWFLNDLITKSDGGELVFNAKVRFGGDKTYLTFERFIRAPNNFTFITGTNRVYSSTIEV